MANAPCLPPEKHVICNGFKTFVSKALLHPEQMNTVWMKDLIGKFSFLGGLIVDCCAEIFLEPKICILHPQHRRFLGCDLGSECIASSLSQIALIFGCLVLNKASVFFGDIDVQQASSTIPQPMEDLDHKRRIDVLETSHGFSI